MRIHQVAVVAPVALLLCFSGCTSKDDQAGAGEPTPGQVAPAQVNQPEGAAKDLGGVKCAAAPTGQWSFSGKLTNSSDKTSEYTVRVSVVKKQGSTVVGSHEIQQKVEPGKSVDIKADNFAKPEDKADTLQCVPTTTVKRG